MVLHCFWDNSSIYSSDSFKTTLWISFLYNFLKFFIFRECHLISMAPQKLLLWMLTPFTQVVKANGPVYAPFTPHLSSMWNTAYTILLEHLSHFIIFLIHLHFPGVWPSAVSFNFLSKTSRKEPRIYWNSKNI